MENQEDENQEENEVSEFLKRIIEIESQPSFEQGAQKTARHEEILKTLEDMTR